MATHVQVSPTRTYATVANLEKAIANVPHIATDDKLRYVVLQTIEGRYYPAFIGEYAIQQGVHFLHFCVIG